tara:strand:+ start:3029 stop:3610 length:582 start_codon:yes stop_codon:yes gene_type:complete
MLGITAIAQSPIAALGGTNASVQVTGIQLTASLGQQILPNIEVALGGQQLGLSLGTFSVSADGNVSVVVTEHDMTTSVGALQLVKGDANVNVTGSQLTAGLGQSSVQIDVEVTATGQQLVTSINSATVTANANVFPTGIELTGSTGNPFIIAWANVDPNVTNTWIEVNKGVSNTWTNVNNGVSNTWTEVDKAA